MIAVVQRVREARVTVAQETVASIGPGLLILVGVVRGDTENDAEILAEKIAHFRIFDDDSGKMNRAILDIGGAALVVSQFTLCADCKKGRRPSFLRAAAPEEGERLYRCFAEALERNGVPAQMGQFAARMDVHLTNDGPVTFVLDSHRPT